MNPIDQLLEELDQWNYSGNEALLWWRDDDAQSGSKDLNRLVGLSDQFQVPAALAVIPQDADNTLQRIVVNHDYLSVLQHGYAHRNHAENNEKKQELGSHRSKRVVHNELSIGFAKLSGMFGDQFIPALVPPWNRIHNNVIQGLNKIGLSGLSCYGPRQHAEATNSIRIINTHADIINWKNNKDFLGTQQIVDQLISHLRGKREGQYDYNEPTGLLTHHLVHNEECWQFLGVLFAALDDHPAATWLSADRMFLANQR